MPKRQCTFLLSRITHCICRKTIQENVTNWTRNSFMMPWLEFLVYGVMLQTITKIEWFFVSQMSEGCISRITDIDCQTWFVLYLIAIGDAHTWTIVAPTHKLTFDEHSWHTGEDPIPKQWIVTDIRLFLDQNWFTSCDKTNKDSSPQCVHRWTLLYENAFGYPRGNHFWDLWTNEQMDFVVMISESVEQSRQPPW